MSCPVSTSAVLGGLVGGVEDRLECSVVGGVVGDAVVPAVPDDVCPGAGEDADGVGVVVAAGDGSGVEVGGPGVGVAGVAGEVAEGVSELFVGSPAEGDGFDLAGLAGGGGFPGEAGLGVGGGEPAAGVADLGEQAGGAQLSSSWSIWVPRVCRTATNASVVAAWVSESPPVVPRGAARSRACNTSGVVRPL